MPNPKITDRIRFMHMPLALFILSMLALSVQADTIKIGVLTAQDGAFAALSRDAIRGVELALDEVNHQISGQSITLIKASSTLSRASARAAAITLVEKHRVDILIGPMTGDEGLELKAYAKTQPQVTFLNGTSAAQDLTLRNPAENFFRFTAGGAQLMGGLGSYVMRSKGYQKIAIIAEDYSFPYSQVMGFMIEYCATGGSVLEKFWTPIGTEDFSAILSAIPAETEALLVVLAGQDALRFLEQYQASGLNLPLISGTATTDQSILSHSDDFVNVLLGTPSTHSLADWDHPAWQAFAQAYTTKYPEGFSSPGIAAHSYYVNTKAALLALEQINADLSDSHVKLRAALSNLEFMSPTGLIYLDENRNGVVNIFLTEVAKDANGRLYNKVIGVVEEVEQTLGLNREMLLMLGPVGRNSIQCSGT